MIFDFRLKVFYTVAQKLSFTKAANELFITQPAVTKHINELEHQLGVGLFKRQGNTISITPAGQVVLEHAQKIFQIYAALENDLVQLTNTSGGNIHIGASTTLAQRFFEVARYMTRTGHIAGVLGLWASTAALQNLPADVVALLERAGPEAARQQREVGAAEDAVATAQLKEHGMTIREIDVTSFREAASRLWESEAQALGVDAWLQMIRG